MGRRRKLEGIEQRDGRFRGTAYVLGKQVKGPWVDDQQDAIDWRDERLEEARRGRVATQTFTVGEAVKVFTAGIEDGTIRNKSDKPYKPSVVRGYTRDLEICKKLLGEHTHMDRVFLPQAQLVLDRLRGMYETDSRVRNIMVALRAMYAWGLRRGYATVNPCAGLPLPIGDEESRDRIASVAEIRLLLTALVVPDRTAVALAAFAGLRAGELLALAWHNIDLEALTIKVDLNTDLTTGELIPPKSKAAYRTIPICDPLLGVLLDHQDTCGDTGPLFAAMRPRRGQKVRVGARMSHSALTKRIRKRWEGAKLEPLGLHEARHTFASMLIAAAKGEAATAVAKTIQKLMGHSSITITFDRYGHLMPGSEADMLGLVNTYLATGVEE